MTLHCYVEIPNSSIYNLKPLFDALKEKGITQIYLGTPGQLSSDTGYQNSISQNHGMTILTQETCHQGDTCVLIRGSGLSVPPPEEVHYVEINPNRLISTIGSTDNTELNRQLHKKNFMKEMEAAITCDNTLTRVLNTIYCPTWNTPGWIAVADRLKVLAARAIEGIGIDHVDYLLACDYAYTGLLLLEIKFNGDLEKEPLLRKELYAILKLAMNELNQASSAIQNNRTSNLAANLLQTFYQSCHDNEYLLSHLCSLLLNTHKHEHPTLYTKAKPALFFKPLPVDTQFKELLDLIKGIAFITNVNTGLHLLDKLQVLNQHPLYKTAIEEAMHSIDPIESSNIYDKDAIWQRVCAAVDEYTGDGLQEVYPKESCTSKLCAAPSLKETLKKLKHGEPGKESARNLRETIRECITKSCAFDVWNILKEYFEKAHGQWDEGSFKPILQRNLMPGTPVGKEAAIAYCSSAMDRCRLKDMDAISSEAGLMRR